MWPPTNLHISESCLPYVPEKGTVGASGDLAPLAHIALGLMGEGSMWSPSSGWADASMVLKSHGVEPMKLLPKEGRSTRCRHTTVVAAFVVGDALYWIIEHESMKMPESRSSPTCDPESLLSFLKHMLGEPLKRYRLVWTESRDPQIPGLELPTTWRHDLRLLRILRSEISGTIHFSDETCRYFVDDLFKS